MVQSRIGQLKPPQIAFPLIRTRALEDLWLPPQRLTKVTSIVAPTGYGKSVLLGALHAHYAEQGAYCAWISLQDRDTRVDEVLECIEVTVQSGHELAVDLEKVIHEGDVATQERVESLAASIAHLPNPAVIFVDNVSYCHDETLGQIFDTLIFATPSWVKFVFSSLTDPPVNRTRLLLEGGFHEVGYRELRFGIDQAAELFGDTLCARLDDAGMARALALTEGWPAALRLTQIILSAESEPATVLTELSGYDRDLGAMLNQQVLQSFGPELRRFLCEIAPLARFSAPLCAYATGDDRALEHINELLAHNALIMPVDRNGQWYRLHGLLREYIALQAEHELSAARRASILRRAAHWCEREQYREEAVRYALQANAYALASEILERNAALFVRDLGSLRNYTEWVEQLHTANTAIGRETEYWRIWALIFHRRYEYARKQMRHLSAHLERMQAEQQDGAAVQEFRRRIGVIRIALEIYTDRGETGGCMASEWLQERSAGDAPFDVATVATAAAISRTGECDFVGARRYLQVAQSAISQSQSAYGVAWVGLLEGLVSVYEGEYADANQRLRDSFERARVELGEKSGIVGSIALVRAKCAVEMDEPAQAREWWTLGLRRFDTHGIVDTAACGLDAGVKLWRGDDDALLSLPQLRELAGNYPPRLAASFECFLIRRLLCLGRNDEAQALAQRSGLHDGSDNPGVPAEQGSAGLRALQTLTRIELDIAGGRLKSAAALIEKEESLAERGGRWAHRVDLALARMTVALCSQNSAAAPRQLTRAVSFAARRRILRPFRDHAEMLAGLVNETRPQDWGFATDGERRFFAEICKDLPLENSVLLEQLNAVDEDTRLLQTPTPRELELIGLIEAGLTNQQIADRLSVSVATVKWHLYNLYGKLGVSNRSAALARARALNLLAR